jgi:hypothetical protein
MKLSTISCACPRTRLQMRAIAEQANISAGAAELHLVEAVQAAEHVETAESALAQVRRHASGCMHTCMPRWRGR